MKNNFLTKFFLILFYTLIGSSINANEPFNFNVTEIEITENGNKFIGTKKGVIKSKDGLIIDADTFEYDKLLNILIAKGNVKINDTIKNYIIYSDHVTYLKNEEKIFTHKNSRAIDNKGLSIDADDFEFNKIINILNASGNVKIEDTIKDYIIYADDITYLRNQERIFTQGDTTAKIESRYNFKSEDVTLLRNKMELSSSKNTNIKDNYDQFYNLSKFKYFINEKQLAGENVVVITNHNLPQSDKFYFASGQFNLDDNSFIAKNTKIKIHKEIFDNTDNDPRIYGASSSGNEENTIINNGVFTSCKKTDSCPPWTISSKKITHEKIKKQLHYENSVLRIYDVPVFYFPKFFHPDPTVKRQSGLLRPQLSNSDQIGTSINIPYFFAIAENEDFTLKPTFFDDNKITLSNEYRLRNRSSSIDLDFSTTRNYQSKTKDKKKNFIHLFSKFTYDFGWENFDVSSITSKIEKVNNNTYLKLFDSVLLDTPLKPDNFNRLESNLIFTANSLNGNTFEAGLNIYEDLQKNDSDRYQYTLPYYDYTSNYFPEKLSNGYITLESSGNNNLINTNNLTTKVVNNLSYKNFAKISSLGFVNNYGIFFKNLNTVAKNDTRYKTSPQSQIMGLINFESKLPLRKKNSKYENLLTPRVSLRISPNDTDNYSATDRTISAFNIFDVNRLGINDALEPGRSLTLGMDYKRNYKKHPLNFTRFSLGKMFRDKNEHDIPTSSSLNNKSSNLFGTLEYSDLWDLEFIEKTNSYKKDLFNVVYDFSLDNNYNTFESNHVNVTLDVNNFVTNFVFNEKNGAEGDSNTIENTTSYEFSDNNFIKFNTRRNRKINLTEYYDLIYEYKNDCLTAGIKYKKTYYQDGDVQPREDMMLTLTIIPITTYEQEVDQSFYRD